MKRLFYIGLAGIALFEFARVYFIMPMPGSQRIESLGIAYFLHQWRWIFRAVFTLMILAGAAAVLRSRRRWLAVLFTIVALAIVGLFNFHLAAESMFKPPQKLVFKDWASNDVDKGAVVLGVVHNGEAKAYPIRYLVYHHQVRDTVGGKPILVTYCSVCRTGRVFEPIVNGHAETFRLVGMDHFNAMFEDVTTGSWWRQVSGEAVAGPLKGATLPEMDATQASLGKWQELHPTTLVMQADETVKAGYDIEGKFERGENKGELTRTDPESWQDKSWVVGAELNGASKAYDWNQLKRDRVINDEVGGKPIVLVLGSDGRSFAAFERPSGVATFTIEEDTLVANGQKYDFLGRDAADPKQRLKPISAHQEFWHSWRTFHPRSLKY